MSIDPNAAIIATQVANAISPFLLEATKGAASKLGEEAATGAAGLFRWLKEKLGSRARMALEEFRKDPESKGSQTALSEELEKALREDAALMEGLRKQFGPLLLAGEKAQNIVQSGDFNSAVNIQGSGNTVDQ
jgi:hypothetical protein